MEFGLASVVSNCNSMIGRYKADRFDIMRLVINFIGNK